MFLALHLPRDIHLSRYSSHVRRLPLFLKPLPKKIAHFLMFDKVHHPLHLPCKTTSELPKVFRTCHFFTLLTLKCACATTVYTFSTCPLRKVVRETVCFDISTWKFASHHNGAHVLNTSASTVARDPQSLALLTLKCTSAQQWCAFPHLNFQKWSDPSVCIF